MISLINELPKFTTLSAELVKINCLYDNYKNDPSVMFWSQDNDKCLIAMTDGNMIIFNNGADTEELSEFVAVLSPACVFSDMDTLKLFPYRPAYILNGVGDIPKNEIEQIV